MCGLHLPTGKSREGEEAQVAFTQPVAEALAAVGAGAPTTQLLGAVASVAAVVEGELGVLAAYSAVAEALATLVVGTGVLAVAGLAVLSLAARHEKLATAAEAL